MRPLFEKTQPFFIGLCASAMAAQTSFLLEKRPPADWGWPLFIGLSAIFGYHFLSKSLFKKTVGWLAGLAAAVVFFKSPWLVGWPVAGLAGVWAAYFFPVARRSFFKNWLPLRASTVGKPAAIGLAWAVATVAPPFLFYEKTGEASPALLLMLAEKACFVAALAIGWDLVDEGPDRAAGLPTLPVRFGAAFSKKVAAGLLAAALLSAGGLFAVGFYSMKNFAAVGLSLVAAALLLCFLPKNRPVVAAKMLIDSVMLGQFLAVAFSFF